MAQNSTTEEVIVIGVDFGTTSLASHSYSGVAWAYSRQPENIEVITNWDSNLTHCSDEEKSPSLLKFKKLGQDEWGYTASPGKDTLRWFKLLLLDENDVDPHIYECAELKEARQLQEASGKSAVEIVSRYLQLLWEHAINNVQGAIGEDLMARCRFDVVITIPAIWPHYAQQRMEQAVKMAGISTERPRGTTLVRFISEPEAAALSTLGDQANKSTVEVKIALEERALCGGIFLDQDFLELIKKKVGASWKNASKKQELEFMNDKWEHGIKRQFRGKPRTWRVDVPNSVTRSGSQKRMRGLQLETSDISAVFDPIVKKIEGLVKSQSLAIFSKYGKEPKYVILVGGFGRNTYLRDCLARSVNAETKVLQSQGIGQRFVGVRFFMDLRRFIFPAQETSKSRAELLA
ncbi:hypothetical protein E4U55_002578 [Claviceps digitariae]|nr:hypothetical protein E4U55_002578 [Claviceps digitariae]